MQAHYLDAVSKHETKVTVFPNEDFKNLKVNSVLVMTKNKPSLFSFGPMTHADIGLSDTDVFHCMCLVMEVPLFIMYDNSIEKVVSFSQVTRGMSTGIKLPLFLIIRKNLWHHVC